jgi:hypothetical protein
VATKQILSLSIFGSYLYMLVKRSIFWVFLVGIGQNLGM